MTHTPLPVWCVLGCSPSVLRNECREAWGNAALIFWRSFTAACVDEGLLSNTRPRGQGKGCRVVCVRFPAGPPRVGQGWGEGGMQHWAAFMLLQSAGLTGGVPGFMTFVSADPDF